MNTGISLYFSNGVEKNMEMIKKASSSGVSYAFTSLHIPEETGIDYEKDARRILTACRDAGISLIVDISPVTLKKLGCENFDGLAELGITHVRLDFGFTPEETVKLSEKFHIVFNASTISLEEINDYRRAGADFSRFAACHNFYPKEYTGLSLKRVREINRRLHILGFATMAFVPGNAQLRGPLCEGLPTVEEHRKRKDQVLLNMLELYDAESDIVLIGDNDVTEPGWKAVCALSEGFVPLRAELSSEYSFERDIIHHDRPDSSDYVIRSQESRFNCKGRTIKKDGRQEKRRKGSICIANEGYARYEGELEIARTDLPAEERVNVIGYVTEEDCRYLPYIKEGMGFKLV